MKKIQIYTVLILALFQVSCKENKNNTTIKKEMNQETTTDSTQTFLETKNFEAEIDNKKTPFGELVYNLFYPATNIALAPGRTTPK